MREELGKDEGKSAAALHRAALLEGMRKVRAETGFLQARLPSDWGDDQHENFTEDIIPPFCILAYDKIEAQPWRLRAPGHVKYDRQGHLKAIRVDASFSVDSPLNALLNFRPALQSSNNSRFFMAPVGETAMRNRLVRLILSTLVLCVISK